MVLVGHSYGGMVITGAADRAPHRVAKLVYLDSIVPQNGQSALDAHPPALRDRRFWEIDTGHDLMITEPDAVARTLMAIARSDL